MKIIIHGRNDPDHSSRGARHIILIPYNMESPQKYKIAPVIEYLQQREKENKVKWHYVEYSQDWQLHQEDNPQLGGLKWKSEDRILICRKPFSPGMSLPMNLHKRKLASNTI